MTTSNLRNPSLVRDPALAAIGRKLAAGERLDEADGVAMLATRDLHGLGALADGVRRRLHGAVAWYNVNRHINYTNVCVLRCKFCGFCRRPGEEGAYELPNERIAEIAREAAERGATEVHVTGGLHPRWGIEHYEEMVRGIRTAAPGVHVKAFTAIEIAHVARVSGITAEEALLRLVAAGVNSLPGGGAEIFDPFVRNEAYSRKFGEETWFAVHEFAHVRAHLRSNATILYGHVETPAHRVRHLLKLRALQDRTGGFQCVVPLSFQPAGELADLPGPTGLDDLRMIAAARLLLDNIPHIKSFWVMHGIRLAQLALDFGADDLDGTVVWYDITKTGATGTHQEMTVGRLRRLIRESGHAPAERDSLYQPVQREAAAL